MTGTVRLILLSLLLCGGITPHHAAFAQDDAEQQPSTVTETQTDETDTAENSDAQNSAPENSDKDTAKTDKTETREEETSAKTDEKETGTESVNPQTLDYIGDMIVHKTSYDDTLIDLARRNNLGFVEIRAANPFIDPWLPGENVEIVLPTRHLFPDSPHEGIIINLPEMRLFVFPADGTSAPFSYPIGVGRVGLETPIGTTKVRAKTIGPIWRPTDRMREEDPDLPEMVRPGPRNPLGTHALYLGWPEYAIHGTNKPFGIGRRISSGCIRLYPEDIVKLYDKIAVDTPVAVVNQPVKAGWIDDTFYVEAHPSLTQSDKVEENGGIPSFEFEDRDMKLIIRKAGKYADDLNWHKIRQIVRERRGYPVAVMAKDNAK